MKVATSPYVCDVCKKRRDSDVNHWFVLMLLRSTGAGPSLAIYTWVSSAPDTLGAAHACGREHMQVLVARWANHGSFEDRVTQALP